MGTWASVTAIRLKRILRRPPRLTLKPSNCLASSNLNQITNSSTNSATWREACLGTMMESINKLWQTFKVLLRKIPQTSKLIFTSVNSLLKALKMLNLSKLTQFYILSKLPSILIKSSIMEMLYSRSQSCAWGRKTTMRPSIVWNALQITISARKDSPCIKTSQRESFTLSSERSRKESRSFLTYLRFS